MSVNSQVARNQSRQTFDSVFESVGRQSSVFPLGSHYEGGQRMVEYFTGHSLNTDRWSWNGEFNSAMANVIDGGLKILPATNGNNAILYMNNIRQFNHVDSGFVTTLYCEGSGGRTDISVGFSGGNEFSGIPFGSESKCCFKQDTGAISLSGSVSNGSSETHTALTGGLTMYAERSCLKATTHSAFCDFSKNGVIGAVATANLPDSKMQPACEVRNIGTGANAAYAYLTYFEAWNK